MKKLLFTLASLAMLALLAAPASAQDATITLIHGIPDTDVDVEVAGDNVFEGFAFGETQDLSPFSGATLEGLAVKVAGTDTVAIDGGDVALPASGNFSVIAHLDADGTPTLGVFENDVSETAAGEGRLIVRHTAAAPEVDVLANGDVAFASVPNGAEGVADLAAGTISAEVTPAGDNETVVIGPADLPITEGEALVVYATGSLADGTLGVVTQSISGLHSAPTAINTGNSPIDNGQSGLPFALVAFGALGMAAVAGGGVVAARARA